MPQDFKPPKAVIKEGYLEEASRLCVSYVCRLRTALSSIASIPESIRQVESWPDSFYGE